MGPPLLLKRQIPQKQRETDSTTGASEDTTMHTQTHVCVVHASGRGLLAAGAAQAQDDRGQQKRSRQIVIGEALTIRSERR